MSKSKQEKEACKKVRDKITSSEPKSLYEYLGSPAGKELGAKVYNEAKKLNIPRYSKNIITPYYSGTVRTYPELFLDYYFFNY